MLQRYLSRVILCASLLSLSGQIYASAPLPDLQGHWTGEAELCTVLCSFTVSNIKKGNNAVMWLQFDKGTWSDNASGYLQHKEGIRYLLSDEISSDTSLPIELRDGKLIMLGDVVFHRDMAP